MSFSPLRLGEGLGEGFGLVAPENPSPLPPARSGEGELQTASVFAQVWITQEGSARADEIAKAIGLENVIRIERVNLELLDEVPPEELARTPKIEPQTRPWNRMLPPKPLPIVPKETWGATANGPIVE